MDLVKCSKCPKYRKNIIAIFNQDMTKKCNKNQSWKKHKVQNAKWNHKLNVLNFFSKQRKVACRVPVAYFKE